MDEKEAGSPEKLPEHTFEVGHSRRRSYLITAENEESKKEWVETFKVCCRKADGEPELRSGNVVTILCITNTLFSGLWYPFTV